MLGRQLGIVYMLLSRDSVTAAQLADHFEVSVRTIYRDVEALSLAGIPVYARKGKNGGISLTENFVLNRMMLTKQEQGALMAALTSMQETGAGDEQEMLQKLGGLFQMESTGWVSIDFSDWSGRRSALFEMIKRAVLEHRLLRFDYYGQNNVMHQRTVEPVQLLFKEYTWYLRAWCREKRAMRLFKIMRMKRVECLDGIFVPDPEKYRDEKTDCPNCSAEKSAEGSCRQPVSKDPGLPKNGIEVIVLRVEASEAWRIYDRFEEEEVTRQEDGSFMIRMKVVLDEWVYGMILSFGPAAEVLEPAHVREEIGRRVAKMLEAYQ